MTSQDGTTTPKKPDMIYHYCSMDSFSKIIQSKELWINSYTKMNDSTEGTLIVTALNKYILDNLSSIHEDFDFYKNLLEFINEKSPHIYLSSFSQDRDLLSQWRAYADDGKGIAIGFPLNSFNVRIIENRLEDYCCYDQYYMYKVQYTNYEEVNKIIESVLSKVKNKHDKVAISSVGMQFIRMRVVFKNDSFSQEDEWRLATERKILMPSKDGIKHLNPKFREDVKTRVTPKGLSTYLTYPILGKGEPQIDEVILGPLNRTTEDDLQFFLEKNGLESVKIHRSSSTFCG